MRLIDADALIEEIRNKIPVYRERNTFMSFVDDMPTAYDPEKVAAELDESSFLMEPRTEGHYADNGVFLDEAINIVRKGGAE